MLVLVPDHRHRSIVVLGWLPRSLSAACYVLSWCSASQCCPETQGRVPCVPQIPDPLKWILRLPLLERMFAEIVQILVMKPIDCGSVDLAEKEEQAGLVY